MELKLTHESICINEIVFDGALEQSIELDYLLPDYCPSIFKVLKCKVIPKITSERITNGKLTIDGVAYIKVIYVGEDNYQIHSITQKQVFSKSTELKENYEDAIITASVKCDYVNCRVINQHRLDIRGAVSIKSTVSVIKKLEILSKADGMGVQVNNQKVTALDKKLYASKEFSINEELELSYGKPAIGEMLDQSANAVLTEYKVIANKVIIKGDIMLHTLYATDDNNGNPEIMDHSIPISQIIDVSGINEEYKCIVNFDVTNVDISLKQNGDSECKCFDAEFSVRVCCEANKNTEAQLIDDIYSTMYKVESNSTKIKVEQLIGMVNESSICKNSVAIPQGELNCVYDITCDFVNDVCRFENGFVNITGNMCISILALDCENMPVLIEKTAPCEMKIDAKCDEDNVMLSPHITISSVSYSMISSDEIEIRVELKVCTNLYKFCYYNVLNSVSVDDSSKKERNSNAVIRLYYAQNGEKIWDIAKKFNTSVDLIYLENSLDSEVIKSKSMLLIPITD
ncbi:MAG: SPOCS domain-containing protein [Oscillospiraceae bacterium]